MGREKKKEIQKLRSTRGTRKGEKKYMKYNFMIGRVDMM